MGKQLYHPLNIYGQTLRSLRLGVRIKDLREKNCAISGIVLTKKSTDETDETEMASRYALAAIRMKTLGGKPTARAKRLASVRSVRSV